MMTQEAKPVTAAIREPEAAASLRREGNTRLEEKAVIRVADSGCLCNRKQCCT